MIAVPSGVRVWLATGHTDMRNYAAAMIMRSRWRRRPVLRASPQFGLRITVGYPDASIAINLSGGRNLPGLMPSGSKAPSISSFSAGSARR